jgi:prolyl-tRNA synthetase
MLRIRDRHERDMLYGPTNEEQITDIFRSALKSYRDLPKMLYHIQWKFRDEVRPRFGVMRGREFLMKDGYSFDLDAKAGKHSYNKMFVAYLRTYARMGLTAIPMRAETGPIGGDLSHEFIILADTGESAVYCDRAWLDTDILKEAEGLDYDSDLEPFFQRWTSLYAATDEKHDPAKCPLPAEKLVTARGIEVGHIFFFGTKYSKPMNAVVAGPNGESIAVEGGSYGIGVSRLVGAIIEASHDERGIIWPEAVAPFRLGLVNLRAGDPACIAAADRLYGRLREAGIDTLYDDRDESPGAKFAAMDLIGLPWQLVVGPRGVAAGTVELKSRKTGEKEEISAESALAKLTGG